MPLERQSTVFADGVKVIVLFRLFRRLMQWNIDARLKGGNSSSSGAMSYKKAALMQPLHSVERI